MRLTADMITADEYFYPKESFSNYEIRFHSNGTFLETHYDRNGSEFIAIPLFNDVSGFSPSGLAYRKLGCSFHSKDIASIQKILLNS
jgi:hypothetical protein